MYLYHQVGRARIKISLRSSSARKLVGRSDELASTHGASIAPRAAHASTMSGKKMMDEMEAMAKKYNPFKVRHPRGVDVRQ